MERFLVLAVLALAAGLVAWLAIRQPGEPDWNQLDVEARVRSVARQLRCPQCQGLSAWESDSEGAWQIKEEVRRLVLSGLSREEILQRFAQAYGPWILMSPPASGLYALAWAGPALGLGLGMLWLARLRRSAASPARRAAAAEEGRPAAAEGRHPAGRAGGAPGGAEAAEQPRGEEPAGVPADVRAELERRLADYL